MNDKALNGWTRVETPPNHGGGVLIAGPSYDGLGWAMAIACWDDRCKEWQVGDYDAPWATHWRELPDDPTAQGERDE